MVKQIDEKEMNKLIGELCAARAQDAAAITEAHVLAIAAPRPYSVAKMKAFCAAGDKMQLAHIRKMDAWNRVREAVAPEDFLDCYGNNTPRPVPVG